jgi:secreted PhoX family phosphatase/PKD repeat protein
MKKTFTILVVLATLIPFYASAQLKSTSVRISASSDDAEERGANATSSPGRMDLTSSDIELVADGNDGDQYIGFRFANLAVPSGVKIMNAYIQFTVDEDDAAPGEVIFKVEDTDNGSTFTSTDFDISSRTTLTDSVVWSNIPNWPTVGASGDDQKTPDLSVLIQSIIDKSGWKSGNAINIIATGTGERVAESYDGTSSAAPLLVVEYMEATTVTFTLGANSDDAEMDANTGNMDLTSSDIELTIDGSSIQLVGTRFPNISIPKGSIIDHAYIQFTVDEANTGGDVDVLIAVEEEDNAAAITSTTQDLFARDYNTNNVVIWNNIPDWGTVNDAGEDQRTPDVSSLLQMIVDRSGWKSGNAILFGMVDPYVLSVPGYKGNTSKRVAQTRDKSTSRAPKLVVSYFPPASYQTGTFPISLGSSWKYDDSGDDLTLTGWETNSFDDKEWSFGNGLFGYGDGVENTTLNFGTDPSNKTTTYYFRNIFEVEDSSIYDSLVFGLIRDDGAIVYVNGVEAFRSNMPSGIVDNTTFASSAVGGSDETTLQMFKTGNLLKNGTNVIAVELHQASASSSDLGFDLEVGFELPPLEPTTFPLTKGTAWHYNDSGKDLGKTNWKDASFDDDNWSWGAGPLGYGDAMNTTISFGPNASNKIITYYFRRELDIDLSLLPDTIQIGLRRDDGALVYLNGTEIIRSNMPSGPIDYLTHSSTIVSGGEEVSYFTFRFPKSIFKDGLNTVAVEIHNRDNTSSDLGFDLFIEEAPVPNAPSLGCTEGENHIACFRSIAPTAQTSNMIIPTGSHRFQMIFKQGDAYTIGSGNAPGNHDFTGYIPLNGKSDLGHLAINHENSPGGVSMLDISYNDSTKLWTVDSSQAVDFSSPELVKTVRNCSGGITPWGTIITAEESTPSGDENNDGYEDIGWLVEIDPITAKVVDYDNDGKQDKLWAMGRMSHENVVVANDNKTAYYGEDGGTHCVYKFVADKEKDLSSGTLYVLQLDQPLVGNDPTGTTAKWIKMPNTTQSDRNNANSIAAALGGTNFNGVEDVEISPIDGKIYFTAKGRNRVYRFTDKDTTAVDFETFVGGTSYVLNTNRGVYEEAWGSGNDNLTFDNKGNLWVLQDGGNNYIWMVRPDHTQSKPKVELFASMPAGSEPTGLTFTPDYKFGFFSVQHPSGSNTPQTDASGNDITFNGSATVVFSRDGLLGAQALQPGFMVDTTVVVVGNSVVLTDTTLNYPTSRKWTIESATLSNPSNKVQTVTFNETGFYDVTLEVANELGAYTLISKNVIEVIDPAPKASFEADNTTITEGEYVIFTDKSTNNPTEWNWTFEGGKPATSTYPTPIVIYETPGTYKVTLTAKNRAGNDVVEINDYITVDEYVGIDNAAADAYKLYPNPTLGVVNLDLETKAGDQVVVELYDMNGKLVSTLLDQKAEGGAQSWSFDLNEQSTESNSFIIVIKNGDSIKNHMIQIIK